MGDRFVAILVGALILVQLAFVARHLVVTTPFPYPLSYPEGVIAHWTGRAAALMPLYPEPTDTPPYVHNPYAPFFYLVTTPLRGLTDNPFAIGRLVSVFSLLGCCAAVMVLVKRRAGSLVAVLAAALFLFSPVAQRFGCMNKPDMLALLFSLLGLAVMDRSKGRAGGVLAGLLCACALLTRPTALAAPLACVAVGVMRDRRRTGPALGAMFIVSLSAGLGLTYFLCGEGAMAHLVAMNQLPFSAAHLFAVFGAIAGKHALLFAGLVLFVLRMGKNRDCVWWYAVFAVLCSVLAAKIGAEENYFLDLIVAAVLCSAALFAEAEPSSSAKATVWIVVVQLVLFLPIRPAPVFTRTYGQEIPSGVTALTPMTADREIGQLVLAEINSVGDPVLCEDLGYLVLAGKQIVLDPYQYAQRARIGKWDDSKIVSMIGAREFKLVLMKTDPAVGGSEYFTPGVATAISEHYTLRRHIGSYFVLDPR